MNFNKLKVLITGGLGFIGSNLAIRLVKLGADVTVLDSMIPEYGGNLFNLKGFEKDLKINISDVRDKHSFKYMIKDKDILFNLAGQSSHLDSMLNPFTDLEINAKSQLSMLEVIRNINPGIKIVFSSTRQIYGKPNYLPVDELHPINPVDINGINKIAGESYHLLYNKIYNIKCVVLRLTNIYGPRMRIKDARQTFLGIWIKSILNNENIKVYGDGKQIRDFLYVDDLIDALLLSAENDSLIGNVYNLGSNERINLNDLAKLIIKVNNTGKYINIDFPENIKNIDIGDYYSDFTKFYNVTGFVPKLSLIDGLRITCDYFRNSLSNYI